MAASQVIEGGPAAQQASQSALTALLAAHVATAWDGLDLSDLAGTLPNLIASLAALVQQYGRASASIAANFYAAERASAGVKGAFTPVPATPPDLAQVTDSVKWATKGLWSAKPDVAAAQSLVDGVVQRAVLDTGRSTVTGAVAADRKARGWARETEPGACSFCAMLAVRGAVYRSESSAGFSSHDHCECFAVPVFGQYEPSARVRGWQSLYRESTKGAHGPRAARAAFRRAYAANAPS